MIKKIVQTVDFVKLKKNFKPIFKNHTKLMFAKADENLKKRLDLSKDVKGGQLKPLKASTLAHRKRMNISGSRPLIATRNLYNSITLEEKGDKIGLSFAGYGLYQAMGFKTHPFGNKNASKVFVEGRPWVSPMSIGQGLVENPLELQANLVKEIRKHLKGKVVHRFK